MPGTRAVRPPDPRLREYLAAYDARIAEIALAIRRVVVEEAPEAIETIYDAYNAVAIGFSFTGRFKETFCHIATYANHVNLGFNRGASLADPARVLEGSGKQIRHVRMSSLADVARPFVREYIRAAIEQVGGRDAPVPTGVKIPREKALVKGFYPKKRRPAK